MKKYFKVHFVELKLLIKNMVSLRCKFDCKIRAKKLGLHFIVVELGEVHIANELSDK